MLLGEGLEELIILLLQCDAVYGKHGDGNIIVDRKTVVLACTSDFQLISTNPYIVVTY